MQRKKILLVDDSETILLLEETILSLEYDVITAPDGPSALEAARAERPDAILLDVMMPGMDGFEVCRRLRAEGTTQATPILLVTSRSEGDQMEEGYRSGCTDYIVKPIDHLELLEKVRSCFGG